MSASGQGRGGQADAAHSHDPGESLAYIEDDELVEVTPVDPAAENHT